MDSISLAVLVREKNDESGALRKGDFIPAVYYGRGVENISFKVEYNPFRRVFREAGYNTIVELEADGKKLPVLIQDVSFHPVKNTITHIDFIHVKMDENVTTEIPLEFVGTSIAVKDLGGTFVSNLGEIEVRCLPKDLVHNIEVDISVLEDFNAQINVKDLKVPSSLEILTDLEELVCLVAPPRVEEEAVAEEEVAEGEGEQAAKEGEAGAGTKEENKE